MAVVNSAWASLAAAGGVVPGDSMPGGVSVATGPVEPAELLGGAMVLAVDAASPGIVPGVVE